MVCASAVFPAIVFDNKGIYRVNCHPQLKYVFCFSRDLLLEKYAPLIRYLNNFGIVPPVLAGEEAILDRLHREGFIFEAVRELPIDYDIMLSEGMGYLPFERYWLEKSMEAGKINVCLHLVPMISCFKEYSFEPKRTKFTHAMCLAGRRSIINTANYNKELLYLNLVPPLWDSFSTDEFKQKVSDIKRQFGKKLLVIGTTGREEKEKEIIYYKKAISLAESLGFRVIIQAKPEKVDLFKEVFPENINPRIDRYALFAAASHVISFIFSSVTYQGQLSGAKVGCVPLAVNTKEWRKFPWIDDPSEWYRWTKPLFEKEYLDTVPLLHDEKSLLEFLSSDELLLAPEQFVEMFGWPKVRNHTENFFETFNMYFGKENEHNVKRILKKNELNKGLSTDYWFWEVHDQSPYRGVKGLKGFINAAVYFIKQGNFREGLKFLKRAEMFSGTGHFAFVQYLMAVCCLKMNDLDQADKCIYHSIFVEPDCTEYQNLKTQIDTAKQINKNPSFQAVS